MLASAASKSAIELFAAAPIVRTAISHLPAVWPLATTLTIVETRTTTRISIVCTEKAAIVAR